MDTVGRTTLTLTALNLIDDTRDVDLVVSTLSLPIRRFSSQASTNPRWQVTYEYPFLASLRKPMTIFAGMMAVLFGAWVIGRLDVSIGVQRR